VGAFLGAALSVLVSEVIKFFIGRRSKRDALRLDRLTEAALDVTGAARTMLHLAGGKGKKISAAEPLMEAQKTLRVGVDHLQMVAGPDVQAAALLVRHHLYAVRVVSLGGADPHPNHAWPPYERSEAAIEHLVDQVRTELGVSGRAVAKTDPYELTRYVMARRRSAPKALLG